MITYECNPSGLTIAELEHAFFVGWPDPPSPATHLAILERSDHRTVALADGQVIGFATALSDGVLCAFLTLVEVTPPWQGRGVGTGLVRRLLDDIGPIYSVDVACDADVLPFYERLGFTPRTGGAIRRYEAQSGGVTRSG